MVDGAEGVAGEVVRSDRDPPSRATSSTQPAGKRFNSKSRDQWSSTGIPLPGGSKTWWWYVCCETWNSFIGLTYPEALEHGLGREDILRPHQQVDIDRLPERRVGVDRPRQRRPLEQHRRDPRGLERVDDRLYLPAGPHRPRGRVEEDPVQVVRDLLRRPAVLRPGAEAVREEREDAVRHEERRGTPATPRARGPARAAACRGGGPRGRGAGRPGARAGRSAGRPRAGAWRGTRGGARGARGRGATASASPGRSCFVRRRRPDERRSNVGPGAASFMVAVHPPGSGGARSGAAAGRVRPCSTIAPRRCGNTRGSAYPWSR